MLTAKASHFMTSVIIAMPPSSFSDYCLFLGVRIQFAPSPCVLFIPIDMEGLASFSTFSEILRISGYTKNDALFQWQT